MELKKCKLGGLIELQRGYDLPVSQMQNGIVPVAGSNGIIGWHNVSKIKPPCITIGRSGSVGKIHYYDTAIWPHNTSLFVKDFKGNDEKYIYYLLKTIDLSRLCDSSVVPSLNRNFIYPLEVEVYTDILQQKRIAHVLSTLDRKISLNRSINAELERMAKEIYDYWFVQFEFPRSVSGESGLPELSRTDDGNGQSQFPDANGRLYKSSGGAMVYNPVLKREVPEGWEVFQYQDILDKYKSTKKLDTKVYLDEGDIPIIDQGPNYIVGYTNDAEAKLDRLPATLFGDHSLCVKYINFPFARGADGTQILYSNNSNIKAHYLYLSVKSLSIPNPGYSRHFKYLKEMYILQPDSKTSDNFEKIVSPIFDMWTKNCLQTVELSKNRDKLLPLLMTGQVEVI